MTQSNTLSNCLIKRRDFLFSTATAITLTTLPVLGLGEVQAQVGRHTRTPLARLGDLKIHQPLYFDYPQKGAYSQCMLIKLGQAAGLGIGPDQDIVAFSLTCTHMGGNLRGTYQSNNASLGPCPLHLSSFDLTRHGILITGNATQSLPQIVLELDAETIVARGVLGLVYGHQSNPV
ncbi:arsenate reductase (azurin) small subunit [Aestuariirhabdus sp. Z084]|uniref:arsenate reductase (azurin) small subunit n=1 Tax=Aestuariirhabdus haliotis TaxID=2918751 RepID=UPI00201B37CE|nr:arsenate reductase (azurin) small subunit [Aestuariirhabdus haliotis]MCL6415173.1 arsenate reductase (azurin) small subunit [Aestuariirhabdus haliotis]MCL6420048.1 arsenate reductase (azurin) small subunit [Aestuariirhabdus haliotis]